jgi:flavin reductase (DIM6/NTAB) family NADH-FMN oxidoreductase RutF
VSSVGIAPEQFKQALAQWASGVTIVTSRDGDRVQGMTVSAFSSVSLEPPLVLVCADKTSITHGLIQRSGVLGVSVLAEDQQALSNRFASKRDEHLRFQGLACAEGATGCPRIPGALVWLDCRVAQAVDAGDHRVYIAEVIEAEVQEGRPLVYFRSSYAELP